MKKITLLGCLFFLIQVNLAIADEPLFRWLGQGSSPSTMFTEGVSVDEQGNAFVTGFFNTTLNLFGESVTVESPRNSTFLAKVSPQNEVLWLVTAEDTIIQGVTGFKTYYKDGFVYLYGDLRSTATFGSMDFIEQTASTNQFRGLYVAKYTQNGVLEWVRTITTDNSLGLVLTGGPSDIVVDNAGGIYISASFRNAINIAGFQVADPTPNENLFNAIIAKLDANGAYQWHWTSTNSGADQAHALGFTADNTLLAAVRYADSLSVNGELSARPGQGGIALIEFNLQGQPLWHHFIATESSIALGVRCFGLTIDQQNNIYMAGTYRTDLTWAAGEQLFTANQTRSDGFIIKVNGETKNWMWGKNYGDPQENAEIRGISAYKEDKLIIAGVFIGEMDLSDDITLDSNDGSADGYWAVLDHDGEVEYAFAFGGTSNEVVINLAVSPLNDVYIPGRFQNVFVYGDEELTSLGGFDMYLIKLGDLSSDASLASIIVGSIPLMFFDPSVATYTIFLSASSSYIPVVSAIASDPNATVDITQAQSLTGTEAERTAVIVVTAEDNVTTSTWFVIFDLLSDDSSLSTIQVDGVPLEDFDPAVFAYHLILATNVEDIPEVTATTSHPMASVQIEQATDLTGAEEERTATIIVTAQDDDFSSHYTVTFRYLGIDATLSSILLDGEPIEDFDPLEIIYNIVVPSADDLPAVSAIPTDPNATVEILDPLPLPGDPYNTIVQDIIVISESTDQQEQYALYFRPVDTNAFLESIALDGEPLEDFEPGTFQYVLFFNPELDDLPIITATAQSTFAEVEIIQFSDPLEIEEGDIAAITVTAENGDQLIYSIVLSIVINFVDDLSDWHFQVYPNPVSDVLYFSSSLEKHHISFFNAKGAEILSVEKQGNHSSIDISHLPAGIFWVRIQVQNNSAPGKVLRIIKK